MSPTVTSAARSTKPAAKKKRQWKPKPAKVIETLDQLKKHLKAKQPEVIEARAVPSLPKVQAEQEIPIESVFISHNDRTEFDPKAIETLATSIRERGLDNAITVRIALDGSPQRFELIAGERRLRALKSLKAKVIRARILQADDKSADLLRLEENLLREDLSPIERAAGIKRFIERHGESQAVVGKRFGMTQAQVSNLVRLLALPQFWQDEIASGRVGHTMIRDTLLKWVHRPQILDHVQKSYKESPAPYELADFERWIEYAGREQTRPLRFPGYSEYIKYHDSTCCFAYSPDKHKAMDVEEINGEKRAFNLAEWEAVNGPARKKLQERQKADKAKRDADSGKPAAAKKGKTPAAACNLPKLKEALAMVWLKSLAEKLNAKKHRQQMPRLAFAIALDQDAQIELMDVLFQKSAYMVKTAEILQSVFAGTDAEFAAWLCAGLKAALPKVEFSYNQTPSDVLQLANMVGLNLMDDFRPDADVLEAYTNDQLVAFAHDHEINHELQREPLIAELVKVWPVGYATQEVREIAKGGEQ